MTTQANNTIEVKVLGRPVNENSARQIRLREIAEKREQGLIKRGRPAVEGSKHSAKKAERQEKLAKGIELRRGRPTVEGSKNAAKKWAREYKLAKGIELRRGRPVNTESARYKRLQDLEQRRANGTLKLGRPKAKLEATPVVIEVQLPEVKTETKAKAKAKAKQLA